MNATITPQESYDRLTRDCYETARDIESQLSGESAHMYDDVYDVRREGDGTCSPSSARRVFKAWARNRFRHSKRLYSWAILFGEYVARMLLARGLSGSAQAIVLAEAHALEASALAVYEEDTSNAARHADLHTFIGPCALVREGLHDEEEIARFESRRAACVWLRDSGDISHLSRVRYAVVMGDERRYYPDNLVAFVREREERAMRFRMNPRNNY